MIFELRELSAADSTHSKENVVARALVKDGLGVFEGLRAKSGAPYALQRGKRYRITPAKYSQAVEMQAAYQLRDPKQRIFGSAFGVRDLRLATGGYDKKMRAYLHLVSFASTPSPT